MPLAPKQAQETVTISVRVPRPLLDDIDAYCQYLGGASDRTYVVVEAAREVLERDKRFQKSRRRAEPADDATTAPAKPAEPSPAPAAVAAASAPKDEPNQKDKAKKIA